VGVKPTKPWQRALARIIPSYRPELPWALTGWAESFGGDRVDLVAVLTYVTWRGEAKYVAHLPREWVELAGGHFPIRSLYWTIVPGKSGVLFVFDG
jgi:hypothetical protein